MSQSFKVKSQSNLYFWRLSGFQNNKNKKSPSWKVVQIKSFFWSVFFCIWTEIHSFSVTGFSYWNLYTNFQFFNPIIFQIKLLNVLKDLCLSSSWRNFFVFSWKRFIAEFFNFYTSLRFLTICRKSSIRLTKHHSHYMSLP